MSDLLPFPLSLLPRLLMLVGVLVIAHFVAIAVARTGKPRSRQMGWVVRLSVVALVAALAVHQVQQMSHSGLLVRNSYTAKDWQRGLKGWTNVAIGGGGYVTGIYLHPRQPDLIYLKTDIGGFYRWEPAEQRWLPLTDFFPMEQHNYYGGEALALDPNDPNLVYIAVGKTHWEKGTLFKSSDRGKTWKKLVLDLPMGANEDKRWVGERLAVNPFDSKVLLFGSRQDGLWRSSDAGKTWKAIKPFPAKLDKELGIVSIAFHPKKSGLVYASAYGDGIYTSSDAGVTWRKLPDSPSKTNRMVFASDGTLYVTSNSNPQVSKYANGTWKDITPAPAKQGFNAIGVSPFDPKQVIVCLGEVAKSKVYQSNDGGKTWTEQQRQLNRTVPWWKADRFVQPAIAALEFDPFVQNRAWLTDWGGVWRTDAVNDNPVVWTNYSKGHEEVLAIALAAPPKGALLVSGLGDVEGFYHDRGLDEFPTRKLGIQDAGRGYHFTYGIAYSEQHPEQMVRIGERNEGNLKRVVTSRDGGVTWQQVPTFSPDQTPSRVAMSATQPDRIVVAIRDEQPIYTHDRGKTWKPVTGIPKAGDEPRFVPQSLAADTVDGDTFYYYFDNEFYRSSDGGATFKEVSDSLPESGWHTVKALPGVKGDVWISLDKDGLYRSTNGGNTFAKIDGVKRAFLFAFGKPPSGSKIPALYLYGSIAEQGNGIFRSLNLGKTWLRINDDSNPIGDRPLVMEASRQEFGLVFVGTNGRGIYYRHTGGMKDEG